MLSNQAQIKNGTLTEGAVHTPVATALATCDTLLGEVVAKYDAVNARLLQCKQDERASKAAEIEAIGEQIHMAEDEAMDLRRRFRELSGAPCTNGELVCSTCGHSATMGDRFCGQCGQRLCEAQDGTILGEWQYASTKEYHIIRGRSGISFREMCSDGSVNEGILAEREEWFEGSLSKTVSGHSSPWGHIRLRLVRNSPGSELIVSNFKRLDSTEWSPDVHALRKKADDVPGLYRITYDGTHVTEGRSRDTAIVTELNIGSLVRVIEVSTVYHESRVRARIEDPNGWISLLDISNGSRWAEKAENDFRIAATPISLGAEQDFRAAKIRYVHEASQEPGIGDTPGMFIKEINGQPDTAWLLDGEVDTSLARVLQCCSYLADPERVRWLQHEVTKLSNEQAAPAVDSDIQRLAEGALAGMEQLALTVSSLAECQVHSESAPYAAQNGIVQNKNHALTSVRLLSLERTYTGLDIPNGDQVTIVDTTDDEYQVVWHGQDGWVSKDHIQVHSESAPYAAQNGIVQNKNHALTSVRLLSLEHTYTGLDIPNGDSVSIVDTTDDEYQVVWHGQDGWVSKDHIQSRLQLPTNGGSTQVKPTYLAERRPSPKHQGDRSRNVSTPSRQIFASPQLPLDRSYRSPSRGSRRGLESTELASPLPGSVRSRLAQTPPVGAQRNNKLLNELNSLEDLTNKLKSHGVLP